jgi:hypothetical protein
MHRHRDRDADLDDETARRTTITLVANAFTRVDDRARPTRKKSRKESRRR